MWTPRGWLASPMRAVDTVLCLHPSIPACRLLLLRVDRPEQRSAQILSAKLTFGAGNRCRVAGAFELG
jgi:hypothetical protein